MQKIGQKFDTSKNLIYYYTKNNKLLNYGLHS